MKKTKITALSTYLPERVVHNREIEDRIHFLAPGTLHRLFGSETRRFAAKEQQVSDLACLAARPIVEQIGAGNIGYLIFASACADLIEPATGNIVQHKLRLRCPVMDVKNACNSFTSGIMVASSLILAGICDNILVVNGEKLSDAIRFDFLDEGQLLRHLAAFSLGDAGAAALVSATDDDSGLYYQKFLTRGEHWELCTIKGGGSLHPHEADKNYFEGQTAALKGVLSDTARSFLQQCMIESGWKINDIQHFITHQVSVGTTRLIAKLADAQMDTVEEIFHIYGNTAAASIPLAMHERMKRGEVQKGDKVAWVGLAAGVSVSVQLMIW